MDNFKHTMLNYILDVPNALEYILKNRKEITNPFIEFYNKKNIKKVYLLGSGTSYNVAVAVKNYFNEMLNIEADVSIPTYFENYEIINPQKIYKKDEILVIGISQSGTSFSTINGLKKAKENGCLTLAFTANTDSPITLESDIVLKQPYHQEQIYVETRGYMIQLLTLFLSVFETSKSLSIKENNFYEEIENDLNSLVQKSQTTIDKSVSWLEKNMDSLLEMEKVSFSSYGINYCTSLEAELKVGETYRIPVHGFEMEEMMHGPNIGYNEKQYIFMNQTDSNEKNRLNELKDYITNYITKNVYVISNFKTSQENVIETTNVLLSPILFGLFYHLLAEKLCEKKGIQPEVYPHEKRSPSHIR